MDDLPELRSDADVDALMARLRLEVAPAPPPAQDPVAALATADDPLRDLLAAQERLAAEIARAIHVVTETLEEIQADAQADVPPAAGGRAKDGDSEDAPNSPRPRRIRTSRKRR